MNWRDLECQAINPCTYMQFFVPPYFYNKSLLFVCLFVWCQTLGRVGHSTYESGPAWNTLQIETFYSLILQTIMDELLRWKLTEQTMIQVRINLVQHTQFSCMCIRESTYTSMTQRQETSIGAKPGVRIHLELEKLKKTFSSRPQH